MSLAAARISTALLPAPADRTGGARVLVSSVARHTNIGAAAATIGISATCPHASHPPADADPARAGAASVVCLRASGPADTRCATEAANGAGPIATAGMAACVVALAVTGAPP